LNLIPRHKVSQEIQKRAQKTGALFLVVSIIGCALFYFFPLTDFSFYPQCPTYALTNTYCPGCGTLRGINGTIHGNLTALFTYNIFAAIVTPFLLYHFLGAVVTALSGWQLPTVKMSGKEIMILAIAISLYWMLRNFIPFLAPHG